MADDLPALVAAARNGDPVAFGRLVACTAAMVRAVARREVDDPVLAEDAVQDTYVRAFRRLDTLRDPAAFAGWLRRIALTVARDAARRRRLVFVDPARLDRNAADADPDGAGAGAAAMRREGVFLVDGDTALRFDQTVPMLVAARGRPSGSRLLAAGKVYRDRPEDRGHMQAFHQAEELWIGEDLTEWRLMDWLAPLLANLLPGARLRLEPADYLRSATQGYELAVRWEGEWTEIGGLARFSDATVEALGHAPSATAAVGAGLGLERIACLAYGVDDVRRLSAEAGPAPPE